MVLLPCLSSSFVGRYILSICIMPLSLPLFYLLFEFIVFDVSLLFGLNDLSALNSLSAMDRLSVMFLGFFVVGLFLGFLLFLSMFLVLSWHPLRSH
jgi:hypothetical protein